MSLAWSLRGQFGHLKGALIPGAFAALLVALSAPHEKWRKAFPFAVIVGSLGFCIGGHMSYGKLINEILAEPSFAVAAEGFWRIFLMGGIWGGLGASLLGLGFSEKRTKFKDVGYLVLLFLFWFVLLSKLHFKKYALIGFGTILSYNLCYKKSEVIRGYCIAGFLGFGAGFSLAVMLLWLGKHGFFGPAGTWWALRDQILGFIGGMSLYAVSQNFYERRIVSAVEPSPFLQRLGFLWLLIFIPAINIHNVLGRWRHSGRFAEEVIFIVIILLGLFFSAVSWTVLKTKPLHLAGISALRLTGVFMSWFLSFWAIVKEMAILGKTRWEPSYSFFLVFSLIISLDLFFRRGRLDPPGSKN